MAEDFPAEKAEGSFVRSWLTFLQEGDCRLLFAGGETMNSITCSSGDDISGSRNATIPFCLEGRPLESHRGRVLPEMCRVGGKVADVFSSCTKRQIGGRFLEPFRKARVSFDDIRPDVPDKDRNSSQES